MVFKVSSVPLPSKKNSYTFTPLKERIIQKASEMFLKLGFKSVTMDDIASRMSCSKKTIYKHFENKELLIAETTATVHEELHARINSIVENRLNAIAENFEIRKMFNDMFRTADTSPLYQLKKHYVDIYDIVVTRETEQCKKLFSNNISKGIEEGLYRADVDIESAVLFYYSLIFSLNANTPSEKESQRLELLVLEYHIRAIATDKGILELHKQLQTTNS